MGEREKGRVEELKTRSRIKRVRAMAIERGKDLKVYRTAFKAVMDIFDRSKEWTNVERYALTDQIRRSSRAVCTNLSEAWRKRRYPKHFVSTLSDGDAEANETRTWLRFAHSCEYLDADPFKQLDEHYDHICGGLVRMMDAPEKWCGPSNSASEPPSHMI